MNDRQYNLLIYAAAVLVGMLLFPPFILTLGGTTFNKGYSWLFSPPPYSEGSVIFARVDVGLLFIQELVVATAFSAVYFYLGRKHDD
jgi:predicted ABC-type sugar transport system permease subunit